MGKTLLTGGTGFIGSHVARRLLERGDEVRITVREGSKLENLKGLDYQAVTCDLLDRRSVRRALRAVDRVVHCAELASLARRDTDRMFEVNVLGTRTLFEECLRKGVERVVHTSSVAAIGPAPRPRATADENQIFTAGRLGIPYVNSKHEAEVEAMRLAAQGLPVVAVNPSWVFGEGDIYATSTGIVKRFLLGQIPAYVSGGVNVVDVNDVADGVLQADERGRIGERYILGNRNYTHDRLFADMARISGVEPPPLRLPAGAALRVAQALEAMPGRPPITVLEVKAATQWWTYKNAKAKRELGWTPSPHEDTVEATIAWYLDRESERFKRARRSQPIGYKAAAGALGALESLPGIGGLIRRSYD
ncbi:MAG TPA: SDR family NAD(P)-dependent oxidoreductase [Thermoleophilaceae bacterium]|nr:SDR family NAD(P)-dependent oxidoreductase [Thermoleophilaceae bacterium]